MDTKAIRDKALEKSTPKSCPFCGGQPTTNGYWKPQISCPRCHVGISIALVHVDQYVLHNGDDYDGYEAMFQAIKIWNARTEVKQLLDENERLQKQFDVECGLNFQLVEQIAQLQADKAVAVTALEKVKQATRWFSNAEDAIAVSKTVNTALKRIESGEKNDR